MNKTVKETIFALDSKSYSIWGCMNEYTEWKGNKCHPFNSRRGRLKGPKNVYTIWGLNLIVFSEKGVSCSVLFTSYCLYH